MTALSALLLGELVGPRRWAAVIVGFIGVLVMVRPDAGHMSLVGGLLGLGAAFGSAGASIAVRQIASERGATIVFFFTLAGTVVGLVGSLFHWTTPDPGTLGLLIVAGLFGGVGQLCFTQALRLAPVAVVAPFDYTQIIWAAALAFLIWGDLPHPYTLAGAALVAGSGLYILHRELSALRARRAALAKAAGDPICD